MWPFKKKVHTKEELVIIAKKAHKKEWNSRLDLIAKNVKDCARKGLLVHTVPDKVLRCEYNMKRTWDEITRDIQERFPNCLCTIYGTSHIGYGNTFCEITWKK
jgi:hypothetical protein